MNKKYTLGELLAAPLEEASRLISDDSDQAASDVMHVLAASMQRVREGSVPRATVDQLAAILSLAVGTQTANARAHALLDCCVYYFQLAQSVKAIPLAERARELAEQLGDKPFLRRCANMLGMFYRETMNFEAALIRFDEALLLARQLKDQLLECAVQSNIVATFGDMGLYRDSIRLAEQVLSRVPGEHAHTPLLRLQCVTNNLISTFNLRDSEGAYRYMMLGESIVDRYAIDPANAALFELYRAMLLIRDKKVFLAYQYVEQARATPTTPHPRVETLLSMAMGMCEVGLGRVDVGMTRLRKLYEKTKVSKIYHDDVLRALIEASERAGNNAQALTYTEELIEYATVVKKAKFIEQLNAPGVRAIQHPCLVSEELTHAEDEAARRRLRNFRERHTEQFETAQNWAILAGLVDDQTGERCFRIGRLAGLLARELGCGETFATQIECAARLHDIGNIGISHAILLKPGRFTPQELAIVRTHTAIGADLLQGSADPILSFAREIARHHHEWWNGDGYPDGLQKDSIPLGARIVALADVYDALTHRRAYGRACTHQEAIEEMGRLSAMQFDPKLLSQFIRVAGLREVAGRSFGGDVRDAMREASLHVAHCKLAVAIGFA